MVITNNANERSDHESDQNETGIKVYLRIRPSSNPSNYIKRDDIEINRISFQIPKQEDDIVNNSKSSYGFKFTGIIDEKAKQKDVFRTVGLSVIKNVLAGYHSTIFAYGQTGSGKTYTITGGPERYEDRGIIPRTISHLFKTMTTSEEGTDYSCYVSYLEIYNQSGYDLLTDNTVNSFQDIPKITMLEDESGNFHFKNLSIHPVASEEEALNLLFQGDTNRAVASTEMNKNSTRSHCIFTMILECRRAGTDTVTRSKLNIVDLAGSERVSRTSSEGQTLKEAKYINSSLFFLEMVVIALHEKKKNDNVHIPYRNSMMTSVLRDSLGGNCKTIMIATISPEAQHTDESISTCHFAQRVALVKNDASINEEIEPEMIIQRLRAEVKRLRNEVAFLQGKNVDDDSNDDRESSVNLPQHEINELTESIEKYVKDFDERTELDFCGDITLQKIKIVCSIFKRMLLSDEGTRRHRPKSASSEINDSFDEEDDNIPCVDKAKNNSSMLQRHQRKNKTVTLSRQKAESQPKIRNICGVPFCNDQQVLDDPNAAFIWFKERYPGLSILDDTKASLKTKYSEAKNGGKKIEEIRSRITYHKEAIERLRRNHAINMISHTGEDLERYNLGNEEKFHTDAIQKEKLVYNETIEYLRKLKGTIEQQRKIVEKARTKMQSDFDVWYREMCSRETSGQTTEVNIQQQEILDDQESHAKTKRSDMQKNYQTYLVPPLTSTDSKQEEPEFQLPPGIKLTGNKEADDDIIAFFKAKEVLLSRTKK